MVIYKKYNEIIGVKYKFIGFLIFYGLLLMY